MKRLFVWLARFFGFLDEVNEMNRHDQEMNHGK